MKKVFYLISGIVLSYSSMAQSIQGIVKAADDEAQAGANVIITNSNKGKITNSNGEFSFTNLQNGKYNLQISFLGKKTYSKQIIVTDSNKTVDLGQITLKNANFNTDEVVITATKSVRKLNSIPASIEYISAEDIENLPSQKIDENLKFIPGIIVDRPFGIFGKSVVGIRGVVSSEPGRQLTLIDGVPINKSDGGGTNWNRIISSDVEHIEVLKGPSASIYGNNAMGGTINIITKRPSQKGIQTTAKAFYGTYNTIGAEANIMQKFNDDVSGFYYSLSARALNTDGYITVPDSIRNETDTAVFVQEQAVNTRLGYKFGYYTSIELEYNYYNDHRGQGTVIKLDDGATADYDTHFLKARYKTKFGSVKFDLNGYYQLEKYLRTIEKIKRGDYTLINVNSDRTDYGVLASLNTNIGKNNLTFGVDYRLGSVYGVDDYQTSTDKVINKGNIANYNIYLQDEINFNSKITSIIGVNFAYVNFYNGEFKLEEPTGATDFMQDFAKTLDSKQWNGFSPRLALQYNFTNNLNIYAVGSQGFRTASLDDLTRTGFISIGYKQANPNLKPETVNTAEIGLRYTTQKWSVSVNGYYSQGNNFMYYVSTGKTIFGGRKQVYEKQNISNVEIYGSELSIGYIINKLISLNANYTYNSSKIKKFAGREDLDGKILSYTPSNTINLATVFSNKKLSSSINLKLQDKIYLDDENTFEVEPLMGVDIRLAYNFWKGLGAGLNVQNIFDEQHMVSTDQVSLGRFISFELSYRF